MSKSFVKAGTFLIFLFFCFLLISCASSAYDDLIKEYNESFPVATGSKPAPGVTDPDYDWARMIPQPSYSVKLDNYLCLTAPKGCQSYSWILKEVETDIKTEISTKRVLLYKPDEVYILGIESDPGHFPSRLGKKFELTLKAALGGVTHESVAELYFVENK